ncbi:hypothetical protein jhhlp_007377 [Lomentospora prolificans]|uniref:CS domain-containing protein n=1 Tax=Lomentospora prolificans TaxID=41688 RepID=A0A2N3N2H5_9PEZI|nr:hypothetical protein jhhlp_007377 [Lomentospora prolificans]
MTSKCVHQGCGKLFEEGSDETCHYHPGPPIFHEGQKGWKCCKPRVLTFEEFMTIPPCTEGKHSTTDKPPEIEKKEQTSDADLASKIDQLNAAAAAADVPSRKPIAAPQHVPTPPIPAPESEEDEPSAEIPDGATCKRKGCGVVYKAGSSRDDEKCLHHPGVPIFHEGSKGYSCCKRRVLEFDQFMKLVGCKTKDRHLFIGSAKKDKKDSAGEEILDTVRTDFYQTLTTVIASFFLKKIDKDKSTIKFADRAIELDLVTSDATPKRYTTNVPLFAPIEPEKTTFKVLGTKLEVTLFKADGSSWPVLRSDDIHTGEILQIGKAGRLQ